MSVLLIASIESFVSRAASTHVQGSQAFSVLLCLVDRERQEWMPERERGASANGRMMLLKVC